MPAAVLIVNYRVYDDVDRALTALRPFLRGDDEVVVVDQESDARRRSDLERSHPRARVLPLENNIGFAAGINLAARSATAPFLLWLNPDTVMTAPVVDVLERWLVDHADTAVVGPRVVNVDGTVQASARRFPGPSAAIAGRSTWLTRSFPDNRLSRWNLPARTATAPVDVDWVAGSCLMTRRDVFDELDGLDESFFLYWEDADYCRRATQTGRRCVYLPTVTVRHVGGRSVALDPAPAIRAFHRSASYLYWKHAGGVARALAPLVSTGLWLRGEILARRAATRHQRTLNRES